MRLAPPEAASDCSLCPRLVAFRADNRAAHPDWFNGAVPSFGPATARLLIVGLAPGLKGANRTGRPFLGDHAGELLYRSLLKTGFARGRHDPASPENLELIDCMISRIGALPKLRAILALGRIAHDSTLEALGLKRGAYPFVHGARHKLPSGLVLFDSYHCSRQNTNTGRLTTAMFEAVLDSIAATLRPHR